MHVGPYEIIRTEITSPNARPADMREEPGEGQFLGYDLAHLGGDFYSAVLNGLVVNPDQTLRDEFARSLNEFELFIARDVAIDYLAAFRGSVVTESTSEFYLYSLRSVSRGELARVTRAN